MKRHEETLGDKKDIKRQKKTESDRKYIKIHAET